MSPSPKPPRRRNLSSSIESCPAIDSQTTPHLYKQGRFATDPILPIDLGEYKCVARIRDVKHQPSRFVRLIAVLAVSRRLGPCRKDDSEDDKKHAEQLQVKEQSRGELVHLRPLGLPKLSNSLNRYDRRRCETQAAIPPTIGPANAASTNATKERNMRRTIVAPPRTSGREETMKIS